LAQIIRISVEIVAIGPDNMLLKELRLAQNMWISIEIVAIGSGYAHFS